MEYMDIKRPHIRIKRQVCCNINTAPVQTLVMISIMILDPLMHIQLLLFNLFL